jgi:DNA-binding transcriptional ArsR family regulator
VTTAATSATVAVFAALGDSNRQALLSLLAERGRASASALAPTLSVSRQAINKHLNVLERAGLVESARSGREVLYSVRSDELDRSARWLRELSAEWDARLATIKTAAEALQTPQAASGA